MIFTLYYMYATILQWWRLGTLKNKITGTLNPHNALLVCSESVVYDTKKLRSFENLLFHTEDRIGCTIVPKQKVNLAQWVLFPRDYRYFPIHFRSHSPKIESPNIYILVQAMLDTYIKHSANLIQVEDFGELVAWRVSDYFEAIVKTDFNKLTRLIHCFSQGDLDINHELKLLKIETIEVEGVPARIKYERMYSTETTLKYSHAPVYWKKFVDCVKDIYSKVRDNTNPKITIENGKPEDLKKVPVSEVKPIKKDSKRSEDKNTLEVTSDYRRHKSGEHKREKNTEKHKTDHSRVNGALKTESKSKDDHKQRSVKDAKSSEVKKDSAETGKKDEAVKVKKEESKSADTSKNKRVESKDEQTTSKQSKSKFKREGPVSSKISKREHTPDKCEQSKPSKNDLETTTISSEKPKAETDKSMPRRSSSSEKKLVKSMAICDETDGDVKAIKGKGKSKLKSRDSFSKTSLSATDVYSNGAVINRSSKFKPPNILVYADSLIAKENVKSALLTMLNRDKYVLYDLPTDTDKLIWDSSTILVVVCGTVPPNMTYHLLQYLLNGGQLLCLCSDLLYSVLQTFSTAEVREHELVRFSYGQWKQVKMMHHIFCYQASPAKKQFSKDSDHSNQSSGNGSSPIAPRTPSAVEIQHNGKDYIIQVQVLGTEETWQTPSLLLATVKGGDGRAIFSQVHLEINPSQYEDDENKFTALKDSDQARMEILKDILSNHLDVDCGDAVEVQYVPAYFLGRHEMKLKLLNETDTIKDNKLQCDKITLKFCGKNENSEGASEEFLPVLIHACPSNFSTVNYFEALDTEEIGRLVIYSDILTSSQHVLNKKLAHGLVAIARRQTKGIGRSNNVWLSPMGSANFSLQLHVPLDSPLGRCISIIQHLVMVAVVSAIKTARGCQALNIGIKWPNDLYANGSIKIGGLVVTSVIYDKLAIVNVGCGINLDNVNPTVSINDLIRTFNTSRGTNMKTIPYETYFATVFNEIEKLFNTCQTGNVDYLHELYYKHWLHENANITVTSIEGKLEKAKIVGIDEFGFLRVKLEDGSTTKVEPDGNSFDMLRGLICPKIF